MFEFSIEDIKIGSVMAHDKFLDTEHKRTAVSREYHYSVNGIKERLFLYDEYKYGDEYEGKYLLQDIAYSYKKLNKQSDDLLLFIQKKIVGDNVAIKLFAISTYSCFDDTLNVEIDILFNKKDGIGEKDINKIKNIINIADFVNERVVIFSDEKYDFIDEVIRDSKLRIKEKDIKYLSKEDIKRFFIGIKPFKKSNSLRNFLLFSAGVFIIFLIILGSLFEVDDASKKHWEKKIVQKQNEIVQKQKNIEKLKIERRALVLERKAVKRKFDPNTMNID